MQWPVSLPPGQSLKVYFPPIRLLPTYATLTHSCAPREAYHWVDSNGEYMCSVGAASRENLGRIGGLWGKVQSVTANAAHAMRYRIIRRSLWGQYKTRELLFFYSGVCLRC